MIMERKNQAPEKGAIAKKVNASNYIATASEKIRNVKGVHAQAAITPNSSIWRGTTLKSFLWIETPRPLSPKQRAGPMPSGAIARKQAAKKDIVNATNQGQPAESIANARDVKTMNPTLAKLLIKRQDRISPLISS